MRTGPGCPKDGGTHPRRLPGDLGQGNSKGGASCCNLLRTGRLTASPNGEAGLSLPEVERPLSPYNLIPTTEEICQNIGLPWKIPCIEVDV